MSPHRRKGMPTTIGHITIESFLNIFDEMVAGKEKSNIEAIQNNPDADWKTVAGTLGAFGRRVASRYGLETLPFERRYDHDAHGKVHRMSSEMAAQILQAMANGNDD